MPVPVLVLDSGGPGKRSAVLVSQARTAALVLCDCCCAGGGSGSFPMQQASQSLFRMCTDRGAASYASSDESGAAFTLLRKRNAKERRLLDVSYPFLMRIIPRLH